MDASTLLSLLAQQKVLTYGYNERDAFIRSFQLAMGRKPRSKGEIDAFVQPLVELGLLAIRKINSVPKGCPGGRPRPAVITRVEYHLTPAGRDAYTFAKES